MIKTSAWARACVASVLVCAGVAACDSVLDIEDPKARPEAAGAGGEVGQAGAGAKGGTESDTSPGGQAGQPSVMPMAGAGAGAGEGGAGTPPRDCDENAVRCAGAAQKSPEICDASGHWIANTAEANADCPLLCSSGKCTECVDDEKRCTACAVDDLTCVDNQPQTCVGGHWQNDALPCKHYCDAGACVTPPSCGGMFADAKCQGKSCCASSRVPGGSFFRDHDGTAGDQDDGERYPAQVSPFLLDKYEVTVSRMRPFVAAYNELHLKDGAGKSPHIADDPGWSTALPMPADQAALLAMLKCNGGTWSDTGNLNGDLPINCVPFAVAYAFCIWDGGRLPTELEWNFAAAGGDEQRVFPWKGPRSVESITPDYANYGKANPGPIAVGSKPLGDGRWGQSDLAGNVGEWLLDYHQEYPDVCHDCFNATPDIDRTLRGGNFISPYDVLAVSVRSYGEPELGRVDLGFRCARDLK